MPPSRRHIYVPRSPQLHPLAHPSYHGNGHCCKSLSPVITLLFSFPVTILGNLCLCIIFFGVSTLFLFKTKWSSPWFVRQYSYCHCKSRCQFYISVFEYSVENNCPFPITDNVVITVSEKNQPI